MSEDVFPRLVFSNSSSLSAIPRSVAKRIKRRCHFPGTRPNQDQLPTVEAGIPNSPASFLGPPNRDTISDTPDIASNISRFWMFVNPQSGCPDSGCVMFDVVDNAGMSSAAKKKQAASASKPKADAHLLRAQMGARLREARAAAGFATAEEMAEHIGRKPQTYRNYERGGGIPQPVIVALAQAGISINYLYLGLGPKTIPETVRSVA